MNSPREPDASTKDLRTLVEGPDEEAALSAIESLGKTGSSESLEFLADVARHASSRARRKAARRAIHALRSRGLSLESQLRDEPRPSAKSSVREAFVGPVFENGLRAVWLFAEGHGGGNSIRVLGDDEQGIRDAAVDGSSRKAFLDDVRSFSGEGESFRLVSVPSAYALDVIARLEAVASKQGRGLPLGYVLAKAAVGPFPESRDHPVYDHVPALAAKWDSRSLEESPRLLGLPQFGPWRVPPSACRELVKEAGTVARSALVLPSEVKREKSLQARNAILRKAFDEAGRRNFKLRLEDMGYYLVLTGNPDAAKLAVAAAQGFGPEGLPAGSHPFALALAETWLGAGTEEKAPSKGAESTLWVPR